MKCPICADIVEVLETRQSPLGNRRRYQCGNDHRFTTMENVVWLKASKYQRVPFIDMNQPESETYGRLAEV